MKWTKTGILASVLFLGVVFQAFAFPESSLKSAAVLVSTEGDSFSLAKAAGKPVLLIFADTSPVSEKTLSQTAELYDYYRGSELEIVSILAGSGAQAAFDFQESSWLTFSLFGDSAGQMAEACGVQQFPAAVILDNHHFVRYRGEFLGDVERIHAELRRWMEQKVFFLSARKFAYTPSIIQVDRGDRVLIKLISEDVEHGLFIDGYEKYVMQWLDRDGNIVPPEKAQHYIKPGELGLLSFTANKSGRFSFRCASTCGEFHPYMIGHLRVERNVLFPASVGITILIAALSIFFMVRRKTAEFNKFMGVIPFTWKFELTQFAPVRNFLKSRWFPLAPILVNLAIFVVILIAAFVGGFGGAGNYNFGVMVVWILWWVALMLFMVPVVGRLWCMMCPFPLIGDWVQRGRLFLVGRQISRGLGKRWPKRWRNLWPLVVFFFVSTWFSGFFTVRPMATFILLAAIIGISIVIALIFEKRTFCLYVCPVSGFQGLYSNFSACEIRAKDPEICKKHTPKTCVTGNNKGYGCPWMEQPFELNRNTYCGMCMECFKTCPHDNMALNIRPIGKDLLAPRLKSDDLYHRRGTDEAFKALSMIGIFFAFFLVFQGPYPHLKDLSRAVSWGGFISYIGELTMTDFIIIPGSFLVFVVLSKLVSGIREVPISKVFVNFSYCLIPVGLAIWGAFSIGIIFPNGSYLVHVISDPFAWGWDLMNTAHFPWSPFLTALTPYAQAGITLMGYVLALDFGSKFALQTYPTLASAKRGWIPMAVGLAAFTIGFLYVFAG